MPHDDSPKHLAWHETMELHELIAFQANGLMCMKKDIKHVQEPALHSLYREAINGVQHNLKELLSFIPSAPTSAREPTEMTGFYSGHLLGFTKTSVRNYALAITETATPQLREILQRHLMNAIKLHGRVFYYMYEHGYYPAYNLQQLLQNDVRNAQKALSM